jgi:alpha-tubulin suppressor-like RCC1 family protein
MGPTLRNMVARNPRRAAAALVVVGVLSAPSLAAGSVAGDLYAFGASGSGQLGGAPTPTGGSPTPSVVALPGQAGPVIEAVAGQSHSLALTATGQLYAFGDNAYGQLGNATNNNPPVPVANPTPVLVALPGATGPVTQIAAGDSHSLALTATGQLYAFGLNQFGELGNTSNQGTTQANPTPTVVSLPGQTGPVTDISAGAGHTLVLTATGQLYAFGYNQSGQLGTMTNSGTGNPNPTPTLVSLPTGSGAVTKIAAGAYFSLAFTGTGQLYAFGSNKFGQLGSSTNIGTETANPSPALVGLPTGNGAVTEVVAGAYHSLIVAGGQLVTFGDNYSGELGRATAPTTFDPTPTLVALPGASGAVADVAGAEYGSTAVTASGQLYAFGQNASGQLGFTPNNSPNPTPTQVVFPDGATIEASARGGFNDHTLAIVSDLAVTTDALPAAQVGVAYSATIQGNGGVAPYAWTAGALPPGLSLDAASGVLSGTPTAAGGHSPAVTVTDSHGITASRTLTLAVAPPLVASVSKPSISGRRISFKITCVGAAGQTCHVTAKLTTRETLRGARISALAAARKKTKTVTVAAGSFTVAANKTVKAHLNLNRTGKRLLTRFRRLPARFGVTANGRKSSRTVRFVVKKKH